MKKEMRFILLLGVVCIAMLIAPQVKAIDTDVGYTVALPVDHNAVVTADCQAVVPSPEFVVPVLHQDPGDMRSELRAQSSGLREESADRFNTVPLPNADVINLNSRFRDQHAKKLKDTFNRRPYLQTVSTSCGGIGY